MATVLVVEDDPTFTVIIQTTLRSEGHQSWLARSSQEMAAILITRPNSPDLVILDWLLGDHTGQEALRWLRAQLDPRVKGVPVLVLTASGDPNVCRRALDAGATAFLEKAADIDVLIATVNRLATQGIPTSPPDATGCPLWLAGNQVLRSGCDPVLLTPKQASLLQILLERPGQTISHQELESRLLPYIKGTERSSPLRQRVHRLNSRLRLVKARVHTERGAGCQLCWQ